MTPRLSKHCTHAQVLLQSASPSADYATLLADVRSAAAAPGSVRAYVEVHIEQGPVLESSNAPLGVVTAIAGQTRLAVSITGEQGHAGTVPMTVRRDALAGAAEAIVAIERRCRGARGLARMLNLLHGKRVPLTTHAVARADNAPDDGLVCTVGQTSVWPGASNVIAGAVNFTVDIRSRQDAVRLGAAWCPAPHACLARRPDAARAPFKCAQTSWLTSAHASPPSATSATLAVPFIARLS
jgi:allantoate deiminase